MSTEKAIAGVVTGLLTSAEEELRQMSEDELREHWYFRWDSSRSLETNMYHFHSMLELYRSYCRRWEEMHHGSACVVERVRDKYLMPKINEFAAHVREALA